MTALDVDQLVMEAEAKWSLGDDKGAAATLERALAAAWGRPDEVARVSEVATRLADARPSEPLTLFAQRAAMGAEALEADPTRAPGAENTPEDTRSAIWRNRLRLIQLAVFSIVVIVVLVMRYLEVAR